SARSWWRVRWHSRQPFSVGEICRRLDGLPLAIELGAARVKLLPPQSPLGRLDETFKVLTVGARESPTRQQTMRATIDWSYQLLEAGEQTLFARLGVFVGGWTLEAAQAVCNVDGDLPFDVLDGLVALLDKSLVKQEEGTDGEPRFTMLETLREYALGQLAASAQAEALRISLEAPPIQADASATELAAQPASAAPERLGTLTARERQGVSPVAQSAPHPPPAQGRAHL